MKTVIINIVTAILLILIGPGIKSQNKSISDRKTSEISHAIVGLNYSSDAVFLGRKDAVTAPYLFMTLGYHHKSGFYTKGNASYLTKANESRFDLFLLSGGYELSLQKFYGDISISKYFFNDESYNVIAGVEADITTQFQYDLKVLNAGLSASLFLNTNNSSDFILLPRISHDFVNSNQRLQISPSLEIQMGSQKFYQEYYKIKEQNKQGSGQGNTNNETNPPILETIIIEDESFKVMAIELGLPIWYRFQPFLLYGSVYYVIPQNEGTILVNNIMVKENLDPSLYGLIGLEYQL